MKKKGLLISTIAMVVVLIAALTTTTYAWFSTSSSTTISGFDLEVKANTAVNIGLKADCTYSESATLDSFVSGSCKYTATNPGSIANSTWTSDDGINTMSTSITHNINWGTVTKAVGVSSETSLADANISNTKTIGDNAPGLMVAANLQNASSTSFLEKTEAVANGYKDESQGDYAYLFLGVAPSKPVKVGSNNVYIIVQTSGAGSTVGLSSAVHVAYRLNSSGSWTDKDVFGNVHYGDQRSLQTVTLDYDASALESLENVNVSGSEGSKTTTIKNAAVLEIPLTQTEKDKIDQLELIIYLAGADEDCCDAAKGVTVKVGIFFSAQAAEDSTT